uniref:Uncharacterized protein n=1 Tax=Romanomermis culicivorax TaxID=13658 RepID=A0A915KJR2_ROMCU
MGVGDGNTASWGAGTLEKLGVNEQNLFGTHLLFKHAADATNGKRRGFRRPYLRRESLATVYVYPAQILFWLHGRPSTLRPH